MKCQIFLVLFVLSPLFQARAGEKFTRPAMLEAMAQHCVAAGLGELADQAANLSRAAEELYDQPSTNSLRKAQETWVQFRLSHKRNQMLCLGPVKDDAFWTAMFFPEALPVAVENVVRSPRPIDPDFIELLGSSAKGCYVLEYLLFDGPPAPVKGKTNTMPRIAAKLLLEGPAAERRRLYVRELARDLGKRLRSVADEARAPGFATKFAAGGQESANLVVNQILHTVEMGLIDPLNNWTNGLQVGRLRPSFVQGAVSGTSLSGLKEMLAGAYRYYRGADGMGVDDYIRHVNPDLAVRLEAQFKATTAELEAVTLPLEQAMLNEKPALDRLLAEAKLLEQICKVDVVSALGVTIMFRANDGD